MNGKFSSKFFSLIMVFVLVAITLLGCTDSNKGSSSKEIPDDVGTVKNLKITAFNWGWDDPDPALDKIAPELGKRLGLDEFKYDIIKMGSYDEVLKRMQLWASTGGKDWPDFVAPGADDKAKLILNNLGEAGKLEDLTPWLEKYPTVKAVMEQLLPFSINPHDGKIYFIPQNFSSIKAYPIDAPTVWIRKDWLDQLKLPYPKTVDEFYETLKKFKAEIKDVDGNPVIPYMAFGPNFEQMNHLFFEEGQIDRVSEWYTDKDGKAARAQIANPESLINALTFYNKLYNEGLIDQESISLQQGAIDEKGHQGRIGAVHGAYWQMANPYTDVMKEKDPNAMFVGIPLYDPRVNKEAALPQFKLEAWSLWAVKAGLSDEQINTFFKAIEYVLSEEGTVLVKFGLEGEHWQRNAEGKIEDTKAFTDLTGGDWNKRAHYGIDIYSLIPNYDALLKNLATPATELREDMKIMWENLGSKFPQEFKTDPQVYVTPGDVENKKWIGYDDRYKAMMTKAVTAGSASEIEDIVMDWANAEKALGYEDIVKERTEAAKSIDLSDFE